MNQATPTLPITSISIPGLKRSVRIAHLTDSHLGMIADDDPHPDAAGLRERIEGLRDQWGRDFESNLERLMRRAWDERVDAIFLTGDSIDFPASASIELVSALFRRSPCPVFFISGNHDWTFNGQRGCNALRATQRHLIASLYLGGADVGYARGELEGLQVLSIDNSTYQIDAEQLAFARQCLAQGSPTVLLMHIPITQPQLRERTVAFWRQPILLGEEMDEEVRRQWCVEAPASETAEFIDLVRSAPNLFGIFCGHVHFGHDERLSATAMQYVGAPCFEGDIRFFEFRPA